MADAVYDFLSSGGDLPKQSSQKSTASDYSASDDPVHDFLASGGQNVGTISRDSRSYFQKIKDAASDFQNAVTSENKITTAPKAVGEVALSMATGGLVPLAKHAIAEGAYLSGESPTTGNIIADQIIPKPVYEPQSDAGKALANLAGTVGQPLIDAGKWAAGKLGLSEPAQDIAGDFSPIVIPKAISDAAGSIKPIYKSARGSIGDINSKFQELQRIGRGESSGAIEQQPAVTPQMIRGQEPMPQSVAVQSNENLAPQTASTQAPEITVENASPELKQVIAKAGDEMHPVALQRQLEADSLPVPVRLTEGQATGDIHKFSDEWNNRARQPALADRFEAQNGEIIQNLNAIRDRSAPSVTDTNHVDNGAALIESYKALQAAREAEVSANYKALADANEGAIPVDGKAFVDGVNKALGDGMVNKREFLPPSIEKIVRRIGESDQQMTFDDFTTLRTILAKEAMKATRAGDGNASHAISLVRDQLENIPMGPGAEALKPLADTAKNSAKQLFKDVEGDPAWKAAINGKISPDDFVKKFIINGKRADVARLKENIGADPIARQTISAGAINYLKKQAGISSGDEGNFSQAGYNKALEALRPKIDSLLDPVAAQQVETLGKVARYTLEQKRGSFVNNSNTATALLKDAALTGAEGFANIKTLGAYGAVKGMVRAKMESSAAEKAIQPGAGIPLKDIGKK